MTVVERYHSNALEHLTKAREAMQRLAGCTGDWSAGVRVEIDFDALEKTCCEFARCQFGLESRW